MINVGEEKERKKEHKGGGPSILVDAALSGEREKKGVVSTEVHRY